MLSKVKNVLCTLTFHRERVVGDLSGAELERVRCAWCGRERVRSPPRTRS